MRSLSDKHLKKFSRNVVRLRTLESATQEHIAERAGISTRYYQSIEAGQRWPSIQVLVALRKALRCDWETLFQKLD